MSQTTLQTKNNPEHIQSIKDRYHNIVYSFYLKKGIKHEFDANGMKISCLMFIHPEAKAKILVVNGYNESYLKYAESIYDFYQNGYSVYTYDHRGQGYSEKFPNQHKRGYIQNFNDLVEDLSFFYHFVQTHGNNQDIYLIAHSMGCAVSVLATVQKKILPTKIVLSSPMFGIRLSAFSILEYPIYLFVAFVSFLGFGHAYVFGERDCFPLKKFENNILTHSKARYEIWQTHIREILEVQLGGPTFQWVKEGIRASRKARHIKNPDNKIPLLLLQAENETLVRNDAQDIFIQNWGNVHKKIIPYAKHEIFMETDTIRNHALTEIYDFLKTA